MEYKKGYINEIEFEVLCLAVGVLNKSEEYEIVPKLKEILNKKRENAEKIRKEYNSPKWEKLVEDSKEKLTEIADLIL